MGRRFAREVLSPRTSGRIAVIPRFAHLTHVADPGSLPAVPNRSAAQSRTGDPQARANPLKKYAVRLGASVVIAAGFVYLFKRGGLPLIPPPGTLSRLEPWAIPSYALLTALGLFFRVHRWVPLLRPVAADLSSRRVVAIGLVGTAAIMFAPLRTGEAARPYLLARDGKVSFFQALGAAGAERVVDGLVLTLISALAVALSTPISPPPDHLGTMPLPVSIIPHAIYAAATVFTGAFVALVLFYGARTFAHNVTHALLSPISSKLSNFVTATLERLADGLKVLGSPRERLNFFGETLLYWTCQVLAQWALMRGSGISGSLAEAVVSLGVLGLGVIVPAGPGLFGAFQIGTYSGLALYFPLAVLTSSGAAMVFVSYAVQLALMALALVFGLWLLSRSQLERAPQR